MPLRDHFRPPTSMHAAWDRVHGMWPSMMVLQLDSLLPAQYSAGPQVHIGFGIELDIGAFREESHEVPERTEGPAWLAPQPSVAVETELFDPDEYELRIYDNERDQRLVAAVEIVSPSNKDRPESRRAFVAKCESLLRQGVCISIVDIVTSRNFNLYHELLSLLDRCDATQGTPPPIIYASTCRWIRRGRTHVLETWSRTLQVGEPLPTLPLWLTENLAIPLELEVSYEQTCRLLRFP